MSRFVLATLAVLASASAFAAPSARYLDLVNTSRDSIAGLEMADAGSSAFVHVPIGASSLQGGGAARTIGVAAGSCQRDVRVTFRGGRTVVLGNVDVCANRTLRVGTPRSITLPDQRTADAGH